MRISSPAIVADGQARAFDVLHGTGLIHYAPGALDCLGAIAGDRGCTRAVVVVDGFFVDHPVADRVRALLEGCAVAIHPVPPHEPTADSVTEAAAVLVAHSPDLVVGLGGGSALDTAKAARGLAANEGPLAGLMLGSGGAPTRPHASLFIAVPTTAGTGSEVSDSAIVDLPGCVYKAVMRAPHLAPAVALLDPDLAVSAPAEVTATAGYDALTHAVEAYVSRAASPFTDPLALAAIEGLAQHLPTAFAQPRDIEARGACLIASTQAGIAFNSAHLGLAHAVAGALGALHHVPHGLANALALPVTMAFCDPALGSKRAALAAALGGASVAGGLAQLRYRLGLDRGLDAQVPTADARDRLADAAMTSGQIAMSPRRVTREQMRALIEAMRTPSGPVAPVLPDV